MNSKIKEFRFAAVEFANQQKPLGLMKWNEIRDVKFAELIVQECVCLVLNGKHDEEKFDPTDDFHQGWNVALDGTATGIKEHFGIEE